MYQYLFVDLVSETAFYSHWLPDGQTASSELIIVDFHQLFISSMEKTNRKIK